MDMKTAVFTYLENFLSVEGFVCYGEDLPFGNTVFSVRVSSDGFSGTGSFECDIKDFRRFVSELREIYAFSREKAEFADICYGNRFTFEMDRKGRLEVSGDIYYMEQELKFRFGADQSVLPHFIRALENLCEKI